MRRLLAVLLTTVALTAIGGTTYAAPKCHKPGAVVAMTSAEVVFAGVVTASEASGTSFVATVKVDRVYKGDLTTTDVRVRTGSGRCGLGQLSLDERYVVMANADGDSWLAGAESGTAVATDQLLVRVQEVLGDGTAPVTPPSEPPAPTYTLVGDESPPEFLRAAAPGIALALIGLLGLLAVRRFV